MTHASGRRPQNHTGGGSQQSLPSRPNSSSIIHLHAAAAVRISVMTRCRRTHRQRRMTRRSVSCCCRRSAMLANRLEVVSSLALRFISGARHASESLRTSSLFRSGPFVLHRCGVSGAFFQHINRDQLTSSTYGTTGPSLQAASSAIDPKP